MYDASEALFATIIMAAVSFAFGILCTTIIYLGSRSLRDVVFLLEGKLDPEGKRGKKAVMKLRKIMLRGKYTKEEIDFMIASIHHLYIFNKNIQENKT